MSENRLEKVDDSNWKEFTEAPVAVLVLTESKCPHCRKWKEELNKFLSDDHEWKDVRFGAITLDGEHVSVFKEENDWLDQVEGLPFNAIYADGEPRDSFYGHGVNRLGNRLKKVGGSGEGKKV